MGDAVLVVVAAVVVVGLAYLAGDWLTVLRPQSRKRAVAAYVALTLAVLLVGRALLQSSAYWWFPDAWR